MSAAEQERCDSEAIVAQVEGAARRITTPCGDGFMIWRVWGDDDGVKTPVILGHGAQGAWSHWIANIPALSRQFLIVAADLPGQGNSAMPETSDHAGISAALYAGITQMFGDRRPVDLVGFSFSGTAFAYCAALYPHIARRLILIGCGGLDTPAGDIDLRRVKGLQGDLRHAALKANLLGLMLHHEVSADDLAIYLLETNARKARLADPDLVLPDRLLHVLADVSAQVDAIWGEYDRPHPNPDLQARAIRIHHPDAELQVIGNAGHWAMYEQPDAFNMVLTDMLSRPLRPV